MALPTGQISMSQVNTELGIAPASTLIAMNDTAVRSLAGVGGSGTTISMQNLQGKSIFSLAISSNTFNYNLATVAPGAGWPGSSAIELTINPGVVVGSTSTGTFALQIPSALNAAPSLTVINNGTVIGMGGGGGTGGLGDFANSSTPGNPGGSGGTALFIGRPVVIINNGTLAGGGGGAGGGGSRSAPGISAGNRRTGGGGGGGAGFNGGAGALGTTTPAGPSRVSGAGSPGTVPSGGAGGQGISRDTNDPAFNGGNGGGQGAAGSSGLTAAPNNLPAGAGGGAGAFISGLPLATFPVTGTRLGPSS